MAHLSDEQLYSASSRLRRLLLPAGEKPAPVRLPPGVELVSCDAWTVTVRFTAWTTPWLGVDGARRPVEWWDYEWGLDTVAAAADPAAPDREVARLVIEDITVALLESVAHEVVEWAAVNGAPLWDAHAGGDVATLTARMIERLGDRWVADPAPAPTPGRGE